MPSCSPAVTKPLCTGSQVQKLFDGKLFHSLIEPTKEEIDQAKDSGRTHPIEKWALQEKFGKMTVKLVTGKK
jgi:hypothetical protein